MQSTTSTPFSATTYMVKEVVYHIRVTMDSKWYVKGNITSSLMKNKDMNVLKNWKICKQTNSINKSINSTALSSNNIHGYSYFIVEFFMIFGDAVIHQMNKIIVHRTKRKNAEKELKKNWV